MKYQKVENLDCSTTPNNPPCYLRRPPSWPHLRYPSCLHPWDILACPFNWHNCLHRPNRGLFPNSYRAPQAARPCRRHRLYIPGYRLVWCILQLDVAGRAERV